ncbi:MAG: hypothetical protein ORN28_11095 [Rhodoferax sp.]|nr:hypothetical protein [Rhodoferax sp.]
MKHVLYCDFFLDDPEIVNKVQSFLSQLASITGWQLLYVQHGHIQCAGQNLGSVNPHNSWTENLQKALAAAKPECVFIWFDDLVPNHWSFADIQNLFDWAECQLTQNRPATRMGYVRLNPEPCAMGPRMGDGFKKISSAEAYQCSLPASIWRVDYLQQMLAPGITAWTLEHCRHTLPAASLERHSLPYHNTMLRGHLNVIYGWRHLKRPLLQGRALAKTLTWFFKRIACKLLLRIPRLYHLVFQYILCK